MSDRATMNGKPVYQVPAKTIINWDSGFKHKLLCDGLTFSTGSACVYGCSFCYVPDLMAKNPHVANLKEKFEDVVIRREGAIAALDKQLHSKKGRELADNKLVIYASPLVDVAGNMDLVRETAAACAMILATTSWDIRLLSKSNMLPMIAKLLADGPFQLASRERIIFGVSTGTLDDRLAKAFEEGTPLVSKRLQSLHWLQDNGYRTYGMLCPSLPQDNYGVLAYEMMRAIRVEKCEHVWAEGINLRGESFTRTIKAIGEAGFGAEASLLSRVSFDKVAWEEYTRSTFLAHAHELLIRGEPPKKLRFLQYVNKDTRDWWRERCEMGAVLL